MKSAEKGLIISELMIGNSAGETGAQCDWYYIDEGNNCWIWQLL